MAVPHSGYELIKIGILASMSMDFFCILQTKDTADLKQLQTVNSLFAATCYFFFLRQFSRVNAGGGGVYSDMGT